MNQYSIGEQGLSVPESRVSGKLLQLCCWGRGNSAQSHTPHPKYREEHFLSQISELKARHGGYGVRKNRQRLHTCFPRQKEVFCGPEPQLAPREDLREHEARDTPVEVFKDGTNKDGTNLGFHRPLQHPSRLTRSATISVTRSTPGSSPVDRQQRPPPRSECLRHLAESNQENMVQPADIFHLEIGIKLVPVPEGSTRPSDFSFGIGGLLLSSMRSPWLTAQT